MLKSIVYVSEASGPFSEAQLSVLQQDSIARNAATGVTGFLWRDGDRFLQCVEGLTTDVDRLFAAIERDTRHRVLAWAEDTATPGRRFPNWRMRRVRTSDFIQARLEELLTEHLLLTRCLRDRDTDWESLAWRFVSAIASLQGDHRTRSEPEAAARLF